MIRKNLHVSAKDFQEKEKVPTDLVSMILHRVSYRISGLSLAMHSLQDSQLVDPNQHPLRLHSSCQTSNLVQEFWTLAQVSRGDILRPKAYYIQWFHQVQLS